MSTATAQLRDTLRRDIPRTCEEEGKAHVFRRPYLVVEENGIRYYYVACRRCPTRLVQTEEVEWS